MTHQHEVAIAKNRGQDVVEIVRHATGKLADRLHLGRLRNLALEPCLLVRVLETEQHRRLTKAADPGDRHDGIFVGLCLQPDHQVAAGLLSDRIAPDDFADRRLVLLDDDVARISGRAALGNARHAREGVVEK